MSVANNMTNMQTLKPVADFIPTWTKEKLISRNCPLCEGSNQGLFIRSDGLPLTFCSDCGLWYVNKIPLMSEISKLYHEYYEKVRPTKLEKKLASEIKCNQMRSLKFRDYDIRLKRTLSLLGGVKGKKILDIGCGTGDFLTLLSLLGADVIGVEASEPACNFISDYLKLKVFCGEIESNIDKIGKVDVVFMNDVIEHFANPSNVLKTVRSILSDNGLIIIWTPNGSNAGTTIEKAMEWIGFGVDLEHLQYFSSKSILKIVETFNFDLVHLETVGFPCVEKLSEIKQPPLKMFFGGLKYKISSLLTSTKIGRVIRAIFREYMKQPCVEMGTYTLFTILRKR